MIAMNMRHFVARSKAMLFSRNCRVQRNCREVNITGIGKVTTSRFVLCLGHISRTNFSTKTLSLVEDAPSETWKKRANKDEAFRPKSNNLHRNHGVTQPMDNMTDPKSTRTKRAHQKDQAKYTKPKPQPLRPPFSLFVTCLPGLEPLLLKEIEYLQSWQSYDFTSSDRPLSIPRMIPGGIELTVPTLTHLYILCLYLGTASHIYVRLNGDDLDRNNDRGLCARIPSLFRARGFPELERKLKDLIIAQDWSHWLGISTKLNKKSQVESRVPPWNLQVHVTTSKSKLIHTKAVEGRVRKTIGEVLGLDLEDSGPSRESELGKKPTIRILVRIERDTVQVSLDATSVPMHMRGYRKNPHKAPLREDLAFALCVTGGLNPSWNLRPLQSLLGGSLSRTIENTAKLNVNLFDPCCGSGTIAIEGAAILAGLPPGRNRPAPFQGTLFCDHGLWKDIRFKALSVSDLGSNTVTANDIDADAIKAAKFNAEEAGVLQFVDFTTATLQKHDLFAQTQSKSSASSLTIVANPPFGHRLSMASVYKKLAKSISALLLQRKLVRFAMIVSDPRPMRETGIPLEISFSTKSGGLSVVAMTMKQDN